MVAEPEGAIGCFGADKDGGVSAADGNGEIMARDIREPWTGRVVDGFLSPSADSCKGVFREDAATVPGAFSLIASLVKGPPGMGLGE